MLHQNAAPPPLRPRQLPRPGARRHARPGDAGVAQRRREHARGCRTRTTRASCRSCSRSAPAAATRERDVRELARALTGWRADWREGAGMVDFRYDKTWHDRGVEARLRQARPLRLARRVPTSRLGHERTRRSSSRSCGATSSRSRRRPSTRARAGAALRARAPRRPPGARRDPAPPRALLRPAHGQAARRVRRRPAPRGAGRPSTPTHGRGCCRWRARRCSSRRTSPAGTTSGGSTRARGAGAGSRPTRCWRAAA